ncbi:hypothetical protein, partial [Phenylobacterium sp.]|uniref:hypothetical protein n=1 Tax=Phenylobacterium sp. TaxID=1871053 RepID=UPI00286B1EDF
DLGAAKVDGEREIGGGVHLQTGEPGHAGGQVGGVEGEGAEDHGLRAFLAHPVRAREAAAARNRTRVEFVINLPRIEK